MRGNTQNYNTISIIFFGLTAFVCLCSLLLFTRIMQPPTFLRPVDTATQKATLFFPSLTPTWTPSITPTFTRTPTPTVTASLTASPSPNLTATAIVATNDQIGTLVAQTQTAQAVGTPKK